MNESLSGFINLYTPEEKERLYKKARTIYKVFKKGKVTRSDGVTFSYELGDFMRPRIDEDGNLELFASVQTITELTWCAINHGFMTELIEQKFKRMFGIKIELTPPHESNLIKWTGKKPWDKEEPTELNEETDIIFEDEDNEKLIKKTKTIYKAFKRGKFKVDNNGQREDALFSYRLSDDPTIIKFESLNKDTDVIIKCEIFIKCLNEVANQTIVSPVSNHIKNRFKQHGIDINIQVWTYNIEPYTKPTELNEETDKLMIKSYFNRNNSEFFKRSHGYWD